jgi:hypothetical protein
MYELRVSLAANAPWPMEGLAHVSMPTRYHMYTMHCNVSGALVKNLIAVNCYAPVRALCGWRSTFGRSLG